MNSGKVKTQDVSPQIASRNAEVGSVIVKKKCEAVAELVELIDRAGWGCGVEGAAVGPQVSIFRQMQVADDALRF
jgi:hypothetical protein